MTSPTEALPFNPSSPGPSPSTSLLNLMNNEILHQKQNKTCNLHSRKRNIHTDKMFFPLLDHDLSLDRDIDGKYNNDADSANQDKQEARDYNFEVTAPLTNASILTTHEASTKLSSVEIIESSDVSSRSVARTGILSFRPRVARSDSNKDSCCDYLLNLVGHRYCSKTRKREPSNDSNISRSISMKNKYGSTTNSVPGVPVAASKSFHTRVPPTPQQEAENTTITGQKGDTAQPARTATPTTNTSRQSDNNNSRSNVFHIGGLSLLHGSPGPLLSFLTEDIAPSSPTCTTTIGRFGSTSSHPDSLLLPQL
eukprot:CAMPEP_0195520498 /NCGR_PEP_ID=MMETSP0794_2-20130614/17048_1 /TAXON_ID=515487 /ORGANISM="Stephanopyxis turris, Strain CCMP 815" /LENGTH=309 /DNA_ID=CAMNT_0040649873 /DNA_START=39 /DNA_END=968 /DNA_ORIENTATION=-